MTRDFESPIELPGIVGPSVAYRRNRLGSRAVKVMGNLGNLEDVAVIQRVDRIPELSVSIWLESVDRG